MSMWHSIIDELPEENTPVILFDGEYFYFTLGVLGREGDKENTLVWRDILNAMSTMTIDWCPYWCDIPELPDKLKELQEKIYYGPVRYGPNPAISLHSRSEQALN